MSPNTTSEQLSIATFNIAHGRALSHHQLLCSKKKIIHNCHKIAEFLQKYQPDILFLQEIDFHAPWSRNVDQLSMINQSNLYPFYCMGNNQAPSILNFSYGNAILSKFTQQDFQNIHFSNKIIGGKGFLFTNIHLYNQQIQLINLHLHHASAPERRKQLTKLHLHLNSLKIPFIIGGDFNTTENDEDIQNLISHFQLKTIKLDGYTFEFFRHKRTIDFFLASPPIQWQTCQAIKTDLSDHHFVLNSFNLLTPN